jgi:hypothetical protein
VVLASFDYNSDSGIKKMMVETLGKQRAGKWCYLIRLNLRDIEEAQAAFVIASTLNFFDTAEMLYSFLTSVEI